MPFTLNGRQQSNHNGSTAGGNGTDYVLPPPAISFEPPSKKVGLSVRWAKIKRRIGNGSAPDDSLGDPTTEGTSDAGSSFQGESRRGSYQKWSREKKERDLEQMGKEEEERGVDQVVVETSGSPENWKKAVQKGQNSDRAGGNGTGTSPNTYLKGEMTALQSEGSSMHHLTAYENASFFVKLWAFFRWRVWITVVRFFAPVYADKSIEDGFQKEMWYTTKSTHIFGGCFLVVSWVLGVSLLPKPWSTWNKVALYGLQPALSIPLVPMAAFDIPRRKPRVWQLAVFACLWIFCASNILDMHLCHFYRSDKNCGKKDFLSTMYFPTAGPVIALLALGQKRIYVLVLGSTWIILVGATILVDRVAFVRNVVNIILFQGFLLWAHYMKEMADRRMYTLRAELKIQYKAKTKAQQNERKQMDARRRFSSYIFHEVRVPLNTALLAVQNLQASGAVDPSSDQAIEFQALDSSLSTMSTVLNDVLDFSKMERGGFSSVSRPFSLHDVMRSIFVPLKLDAHARGLALETSLDLRIDQVAKQAAYPELKGNEVVAAETGEGWMMGDENRLRQVINNLASNACKFTAAGGTVSISTTLVYPDLQSVGAREASTDSTIATDVEKEEADAIYTPRLSTNRLQQHEAKTSPQEPEGERVLVARIEVRDTGVGIRAKAMREDRSLFSAYVQTEIGRKQGGKGTGLGLSLVRNIVQLSGGRLGVKSRVGEGSTFWVELPFNIGPQTRDFDDGLGNVGSLVTKNVIPTPPSSSDSNEYKFVSSLGYTPSSVGLDSIGEKGGIEMTQTSYDFSPPDSDVIKNAPKTFIPLTHGSGSAESTPPPTPLPTQGLSIASFPSSTPPPAKSASISSSLNISASAVNDQLLQRPAIPQHKLSSASAPPAVTTPGPSTPTSPLFAASSTIVSSTSSRPSSANASNTPAPLVRMGVPPPASSGAPSRPKALEFADGPLKVLVVDDDMLTRKLMSRMLERLGCIVSTAENGKIALEMLLGPNVSAPESATSTFSFFSSGQITPLLQRSASGIDPMSLSPPLYHITFLDNQMPVASGLQVVQRMRSLGRQDLIVGVTANALRTDQEEYLEQGASFVLTKPVLEVDLRRFLVLADKRRSESQNPAAQLGRFSTSESRPTLPLY